MHSQKNLSDNYTFAFAGPEEQSPSSGDEEGSTCDGWEDGAALGKDTGAVQSIKSQFFTSVFSFPEPVKGYDESCIEEWQIIIKFYPSRKHCNKR